MSTPREPLDRDEAELAVLLRRLPAGEPGPAVDARILAAARAAPARRSVVRRPWIWSLGTAAAAVLAFGTLLRMQEAGFESVPEVAPQAAPETASMRENEADARLERVEVSGNRVRTEAGAEEARADRASEKARDASEPEPFAARSAAPDAKSLAAPSTQAAPAPAARGVTPQDAAPHSAPAESRSRPGSRADDAVSAMSVPVPPPAPPAPAASVLMQESTPASATSAEHAADSGLADQPASPLPSEAPRRALRDQRATTLDAAAATKREDAPPRQQERTEAIGALRKEGTRLRELDADAEAGAAETPEAGLERIRALLARGEREAAREALRRWRKDWPEAELPEDLRALLE